MLKVALVISFVLLLFGCSSTAGVFYNRPVVENSVDKAVSTVSLSADRRTVVVVTEGENRTKFCAEPPPDTATGLKAELDASIEAKAKSEKAKLEAAGKLTAKDTFITSVTVIADRTAPLDAFRTGVYALCQFHLNGAVGKDDIKPLFIKLIEAFSAAQAKGP
jgi:hypothetical protein